MGRSRLELAPVKFRFSSAGGAVVATAGGSLSSRIFNLRHFFARLNARIPANVLLKIQRMHVETYSLLS